MELSLATNAERMMPKSRYLDDKKGMDYKPIKSIE
jgi:hypothetical protein